MSLTLTHRWSRWIEIGRAWQRRTQGNCWVNLLPLVTPAVPFKTKLREKLTMTSSRLSTVLPLVVLYFTSLRSQILTQNQMILAVVVDVVGIFQTIHSFNSKQNRKKDRGSHQPKCVNSCYANLTSIDVIKTNEKCCRLIWFLLNLIFVCCSLQIMVVWKLLMIIIKSDWRRQGRRGQIWKSLSSVKLWTT